MDHGRHESYLTELRPTHDVVPATDGTAFLNMHAAKGRFPHSSPHITAPSADRLQGSIRAYAPDLLSCGIDQETWMDFLVPFTPASRALKSKWMAALNLAGNVGCALPPTGTRSWIRHRYRSGNLYWHSHGTEGNSTASMVIEFI